MRRRVAQRVHDIADTAARAEALRQAAGVTLQACVRRKLGAERVRRQRVAWAAERLAVRDGLLIAADAGDAEAVAAYVQSRHANFEWRDRVI